MRLIDADELIEHLRKDPLFELVERYGIVDVIDSRPTVGVKHGEWLRSGEPPMYVVECSNCGQKYFIHALQPLARYCSTCGAKMDGGDD